LRTKTCDWCGKEVDIDSDYCKYCGQVLKAVEGYRYRDMHDLSNEWKKNINFFEKIWKSEDDIMKITDIIEEKQPKLLEKQRNLTQFTLDTFPAIKELLRKDEDLVFYAKILQIPYEQSGGIKHDCIQHKVAMEQNGLINISVGGQRIAPNICISDFPIWAPEGVGEVLIQRQARILASNFPEGQKELLVSASPWAVCNRVYGYEGRWISWRLIFNTEKMGKWKEEHQELPLNFPFFGSLRFSRFFPIAGTISEGEVMLAIVEESERDLFENILKKVSEEYSFRINQIPQQIKISWGTLAELGLIGLESTKIGHVFSSKLVKKLIADSTRKFGSLTEDSNVRPEEKDKTKYILSSAHSLIDEYTMDTWYSKIFHIMQPIPDSLREKYQIRGHSTIGGRKS
jgi:hypothetical protein